MMPASAGTSMTIGMSTCTLMRAAVVPNLEQQVTSLLLLLCDEKRTAQGTSQEERKQSAEIHARHKGPGGIVRSHAGL